MSVVIPAFAAKMEDKILKLLGETLNFKDDFVLCMLVCKSWKEKLTPVLQHKEKELKDSGEYYLYNTLVNDLKNLGEHIKTYEACYATFLTLRNFPYERKNNTGYQTKTYVTRDISVIVRDDSFININIVDMLLKGTQFNGITTSVEKTGYTVRRHWKVARGLNKIYFSFDSDEFFEDIEILKFEHLWDLITSGRITQF